MDDQVNVSQEEITVASLHHLTCPECGAGEFRVLGTKGAKGKALKGGAFGAIGHLVANSINKGNLVSEPVQYKCISCRKKFISNPLAAEPEEILSEPCTINFIRLSAFAGGLASQTVWLNGIKMGSIKNKQTITFQTFNKNNILFVTNQYGIALKGDYKFEAQPGKTVDVRYKNKFV